MNIDEKPTDSIFENLKGKDNLDLLNEVKFHKSRMKYREIRKNSGLSKFKLLHIEDDKNEH